MCVQPPEDKDKPPELQFVSAEALSQARQPKKKKKNKNKAQVLDDTAEQVRKDAAA